MGLDLNRWFNYAKARVNSAVGQANSSLDQREAEREADLADKPWLRSDGEAPTMEEARARIEWEAERQRVGEATDPGVDPDRGRTGAMTPSTGDQGDRPERDGDPVGAAPRSPQDLAADAEQETARLELERRTQASADRLKAIRAELGVDDPAPPPDEG